MNEFDFIASCLAPLARGEKGAFGLTDDAAFLNVPEGQTLVITKDAITAGVHFTGAEPAGLIAQKLLRVNLSDLAAKGAAPWGYFLALMLPAGVDDPWLRYFAKGLGHDQQTFGLTLMGGDTVRTQGPLSLSLTALGLVPQGQGLLRGGAQSGDAIYVSGTIGDGALGLHMIQGMPSASMPARDFLTDRYHLPQPRLALGKSLRGLATSAMDISDGLVQDLGHLCKASGLGAQIDYPQIPLSSAASGLREQGTDIVKVVLAGGDDYELLFTVPVATEGELTAAAQACGTRVSRIGHMRQGGGVHVLDAKGHEIPLESQGYRHF